MKNGNDFCTFLLWRHSIPCLSFAIKMGFSASVLHIADSDILLIFAITLWFLGWRSYSNTKYYFSTIIISMPKIYK